MIWIPICQTPTKKRHAFFPFPSNSRSCFAFSLSSSFSHFLRSFSRRFSFCSFVSFLPFFDFFDFFLFFLAYPKRKLKLRCTTYNRVFLTTIWKLRSRKTLNYWPPKHQEWWCVTVLYFFDCKLNGLRTRVRRFIAGRAAGSVTLLSLSFLWFFLSFVFRAIVIRIVSIDAFKDLL